MWQCTPLGVTDWRNQQQLFGIKDADRLGHIYAIGKTGTGKSTLLLTMAISDIERGNGFAILDPHGDIAETILQYIPSDRIEDVVYFNVTDSLYPVGFNPLQGIDPEHHNLVAAGLIGAFKKIWADSWGPRLEHILRFTLLSLLHYPFATLLDIQPMLTNAYFRNRVLFHIPDALVLAFWREEFDKYPAALRSEAITPILNKTGLLIASLPLRYIVGQQISSFRIQEVMDQRKILICNLSKGQIGEDASALLGSMILTSIQSAALYRATYDPLKRVPFYLYVDEMHSFVTLSFVDILAESRKYGLSLFLTHQYIEQLNEKICAAIFGNVGTLICFRVGADDAEYLVKEFHPIFTADDLINLPRYAMYIKLQIDGATSKPFSATSIPLHSVSPSYKEHIVRYSREKYARPFDVVNQELEKKNRSIEPSGQQGLFAA